MAITQQLQAEAAVQNNTSLSTSVSLGAGSNRVMLVAVGAERSSLAAPTSVTYGGNALSLVTDGTDTASHIEGTTGGCFWYRLLEANMPSNGANNLVINWPGTAVNYAIGWWILEGASQSANVVDVANTGASTTATTISATVAAGATTDMILCVAYGNNSTGTVAITIGGTGVTEDFDIDLTTGGARIGAGTDLPAVSSGTQACVATVTSSNRRIISAIRIAEAAAAREITGGFSIGATTVTGSVNHNSEITGGFSTGAVTVTGNVSSPRNISGNVQAGAVTVSGDVTGTTTSEISGGFSTPPVEVSCTADVQGRGQIFGPTITAPVVAASAELAVVATISGNVQLGAVTVAGEVDVVANISGGITTGAVTVSGSVSSTLKTISGNVQLGAVQVSGSVQTQFHGTVFLSDDPAFGSELVDEEAGAAYLLDELEGSATLDME